MKQNSAHAAAPIDYALFDRDSDIVVLTPNSRPQPKVLKVEGPNLEETVSEETIGEQVQEANYGESSTNILTGMGNQLMKLVSPPKKKPKGKQKGLRLANLPKEDGGSLTRTTAKRAGIELPEVFGDNWNLPNPP